MTTALLLLVLFAESPADAVSLRREATGLYRARKYAQACPRFEAATRADPKSADAFADLGLCLAKLGKKPEAVAANQKAIELGDEKVRRNAYFNLDALGVTVTLPAAGKCGAVGQGYHGCTFAWEAMGSGGGSRGTGVRIGVSAEHARLGAERPERPSSAVERNAQPPTGEGFLGVAAADLLLTEQMEDFCRCPPGDAACKSRCGKGLEQTACRVVHATPPAVGWVCSTTVDRKKRTVAAEYLVAVEEG